MKPIPIHDYFAPLNSPASIAGLRMSPEIVPIVSLPTLVTLEKFRFDSADRFTYVIMGLALLIAILVPALNWN